MEKINQMAGKRIKITGLALLLSIISLTQIHAQNAPPLIWSKVSGTWGGGYDDSFAAIAVDPTNPNRILLGSSSGAGIFESTDGGVTWSPKNSGVPMTGDFPVISKIIISPSNPNIIYFGTANDNAGDIYKSTDGGESWQQFSGQQNLLGIHQLNGAVYDFDVSPTDPNTVYAGVTGQGVMKTTDGGADWSVVFAAGNNTDDARDYVNVVRIIPTSPETVFFSGFTYITADSIPAPTPDLDTTGTIGCSPFPLRKSTDGGLTWSISPVSWPTFLDVPLDGMITDLQYEKADGSLFFSTIAYQTTYVVFIGNKGIYKSTDLGGSWQAANQASFGSLDQTTFVSMSANPSTVNKGIFASAGFGGIVVASTNAGNNWMQLDPCLSSAFIAKTALAGNKLFALTDLGIFVTDISSLYAPVTPTISSISPATLPPSSSPQLITINGSNFLPSTDPNASTLVFFDPANNSYTRTPINVTPTSMQYNINVQSATGTWQVKVLNGNIASSLYNFTVASVNAQLTGISISGSASVAKNGTAQYTTTAIFSDGTTSTITPTWGLSSGAPASISSSGQLTAGNIGANTSITITASYTSGGITKTANYNVNIVTGTTSYQSQELISNGTFANGSTGWTLTGNFQADTRFSTYNNEIGYAYLANTDGSAGNNLYGTLNQTVLIPANAKTATLGYYYRITTADVSGIAHDHLHLQLSMNSGNTLVGLDDKSNLNANSAYGYASFDVSAYAGKTVTVQFIGTNDATFPTTFRVDDVSLLVSVPIPPTPVLFGVGGPTSVPEGNTAQYNAILVYSDGSVQSVSPNWSVSGPATITSSGFLTSQSVNNNTAATVTASYNGFTTLNYNITILNVAPVFSYIAISGPNSMNENGSSQFTASAIYSDGTSQIISPNWSVISGSGSISASGLFSAGQVNGDTTTTISANYTIGGITRTGTAQVLIAFVQPPPALTAINISGPSMVNENQMAQYSATALFADGSSQVINPIWSESLPAASISTTGLFNADIISSNTPVIISASFSDGGITCAASNNVTVVHIVPTISFQTSGNQIILSWPASFVGYSLENTSNLYVAAWVTNSTSPTIVGQQFFVTNSVSNGSMFYRLTR
jgi:hypothetical protein